MNSLLPDASIIFQAATVDPEIIAKMVGVSSLTLSEVWEDVRKVASTVAKMYTDPSCFALSYDDLYAECMGKVVKAIQKGYLKKPRGQFFKLIKTAMNNHVRGIVQRHRFTIKRTGHRPPERGDLTATNSKPEISLDDPENGLQIANMADGSLEDLDQELIEDVRVFLTPTENLVLNQLLNPNEGAFLHAYLEASLGRRRQQGLNVKLGQVSMAYGLGMDLDSFSKVQESIKRKYMTQVMNDKPEDVKLNVAISTLEQIYGVQVPRSTEKIVVSRLFTICARDQLDKITPEIEKLLAMVGAKPPVVEDGRLSCFGVLYQKNHRICQACGLRPACQVEAANHGLGEITLSPKLLGSRNVRFATLTDNPQSPMSPEPSESQQTEQPQRAPQPETPPVEKQQESVSQREPFTNTERDEVLLHHLREHYKPIKFGLDVYYTHKDGKNACVFYIGKEGERFELRFCKPSEELKKSLARRVRSFYLPDDAPTDKSIELIDLHGNATFRKE